MVALQINYKMDEIELGQAIKDASDENFVGEYTSVESFIQAMNGEN